MKHLRFTLFALSSFAFLTAARAQPAVTPDMAVMNLDKLGVYAVGYAYRGQPEQQFPLGWSGFFADRTGVACEPFGTQNGERERVSPTMSPQAIYGRVTRRRTKRLVAAPTSA